MEETPEKLGIIWRTVDLLFEKIQSASILGWKYKITGSCLEVYDEVLYDLLNDSRRSACRTLRR